MKNTLEQNNSTNSHKVNEQRKPCDQQWNNKRIAAKEETMDKWWQQMKQQPWGRDVVQLK